MSFRPPKKFVPEPYDYHQEIELIIDSLSNLGHGVGRDEGWVVFVPFCLPGETVKARIYRNEKNCSHADLIEIIEASPDRLDAPCPLFTQCGGCQYQHLSYQKQLEWKRDQVGELLQRMAGIETTVNDTLPSPVEYNYRSKLTPHFQKPQNGKINEIGFLKIGRRQQIIDVAHCPIAMEEINSALPELRNEARANAKNYKRGATLLMRATEGRVETNPQAVATERVGNLEFNFLAGDFFQNNPFILEAFVDYAGTQAAGGTSKFLVDAYCGSGLFALSLAHRFEKVSGVEVSETSADWARQNARTNHITNAEFLAASAETIFEKIDYPTQETTVLIDPPRKGCNELFLNQLFTFKPHRVVYISCNPATQIRDLAHFTEAGYKLDDVQPVDLFPQTRHLECIVTLSLT